MTRISSTNSIIVIGTDHKGGSVSGHAHRPTKKITCWFTINVQFNLVIRTNGRIKHVDTNMTRITAINTIIKLSTDHERCTVGGHAHGTTKIIISCFTINVQSKLGVRIDSRVKLVDTNMTRISALNTIVEPSTDDEGCTVSGHAHRKTRLIISCFTINVQSNLGICIDSWIKLIDTNMTRIDTINTTIRSSTDHERCTVCGHAHWITKFIKSCFTINVQSNLGIRIDSRIELVDPNMTRTSAINTIIEYRTDDKGCTVAGHARRPTKKITSCFTINVQPNLSIRIDSRIKLVDTNMTRIGTINTIIANRADDKGWTVAGHAHRPTKLITICFTINAQSKFIILIDSRIQLVNANTTRIGTIDTIFAYCTDHKSRTVAGHAHGPTKKIISCFTINIRSDLH